MTKLRTILEDTLAVAYQQALNESFRARLCYDDRYEGDHLALHAHHHADGACAWEVALLDPGARITLYAESAAAATRMEEALFQEFASGGVFWQVLRRRVRRRMYKSASDLARSWATLMASRGAPQDALRKLQRLFPGAPLMAGLSRRVQSKEKDAEAHIVHITEPKRRRLRARFAALVPTRTEGGVATHHRAAPFIPSRGVFLLHGMTPEALAAFEAQAGVTAQDAHAALPPFARTPTTLTSDQYADWTAADSVGFCAEAGCHGLDVGFMACDLWSSCDGGDGCDIGGCDW